MHHVRDGLGALSDRQSRLRLGSAMDLAVPVRCVAHPALLRLCDQAPFDLSLSCECNEIHPDARTQRLHRNTAHGGLGSIANIHEHPSLNHHFWVFHAQDLLCRTIDNPDADLSEVR